MEYSGAESTNVFISSKKVASFVFYKLLNVKNKEAN
jgi:hypothetical protein